MSIESFVIILFVLLGGGAALLLLGIILRVALRKRALAGERWAGRLRKLAIVSIVLGANAVLLPLIFFGFVLKVSATPPAGYVDTGIVIEEEGYQEVRFTANGITYVRLPFQASNRHGEAVFTYKEGGWYNARWWGNYFRMENGIDCDLVSNGRSDLFCPEDAYDRVIAAYENSQETDSIWLANLRDEIEVSDELRAAFRAVQMLDGEGRMMEADDYDDFDFLVIDEFSFDGVVSYGGFELFYLPEGVYLRKILVLDGEGMPRNYLLPVPEEYQSILMELEASIPFP